MLHPFFKNKPPVMPVPCYQVRTYAKLAANATQFKYSQAVGGITITSLQNFRDQVAFYFQLFLLIKEQIYSD